MPDYSRRRVWLYISITITTILCILIYLTSQIQAMHTNFQIQKIEQQISALEHENTLMEIELAKNNSLENIDEIAVTKLKMQRPEKVEYIILPKPPEKNKRKKYGK